MGAHPTQIAQRKKAKRTSFGKSSNSGISKTYYRDLSNTIPPPTPNKSIWELIRTGEELQSTIDEIRRKATLCVPEYNKGGLNYIGSNKESMRNAGRKI